MRKRKYAAAGAVIFVTGLLVNSLLFSDLGEVKPDPASVSEPEVLVREDRGPAVEEQCNCKLAAQAEQFSQRLEDCNLHLYALQNAASSPVAANVGLLEVGADSQQTFSHKHSTCTAPFFDNSVAVGSSLTFTFVARDSAGKNLTMRVPYFRAVALSKANPDGMKLGTVFKLPVTLEDDPAGPELYSGSFYVPEEGEFLLQVSREGKLFCEHSFSVVPMRTAINAPESHPTCRSVELYSEGFWRDKYTWTPVHCLMPKYEREAVRNTNVLFIGDSLVRCIFWCYSTWMKGEPTSSHFKGYKLSRYDVSADDIKSASAFELRWEMNEHKNVVMDSQTLLNVLDYYARKNYDLNQHDCIVIGVGAHDLARNEPVELSYQRFQKNLQRALQMIFYQFKFRNRLVWISETPAVPEKLVHGVLKAYKTYQLEYKVRKLNAIAKQILSTHGVPMLDIFNLALTRPELCFDGQHYVRGVDTTKDYVYTNTVQALVHFAFANKQP